MSRRMRLGGAVAASLFLALALMNLFLVAEQAPAVRPSERDGVTWQTGTGAAEQSGRHTWEFVVEPKERRIVELEVVLDYRVRVTHVEGEASLSHIIGLWVDGEHLDGHEDSVAALPRENTTTRVSRTWSEQDSFASSLHIARAAGSAPFVLLVTWDWELVADAPAQVTFETEVQPFGAAPVDLGGVPGCSGPTCARVLVLVAAVAQVGTFAWFRVGGRDPSKKEPAKVDPRR